LKVLAEERRRFGYRRLWVLLRREGHAVNRKRVYRLYKQERLMVDDQMTDGRRLRIFAVVDDYTRECLALVADTSISGVRAARELDKIVAVAASSRTMAPS